MFRPFLLHIPSVLMNTQCDSCGQSCNKPCAQEEGYVRRVLTCPDGVYQDRSVDGPEPHHLHVSLVQVEVVRVLGSHAALPREDK